jgi:hypothetical protein
MGVLYRAVSSQGEYLTRTEFFITTIVMALQPIFPRVDATLAQLRELGEARQYK